MTSWNLQRRLLPWVARVLAGHPRLGSTVLLGMMLGGAGTLAAAAFGPDPSLMPVRQIVEPVLSAPSIAPLDAQSIEALRLYRTTTTKADDSVNSILARVGVLDSDAAHHLRQNSAFRTHILARSGRNITVEAGIDHRLEKLSAKWPSKDSHAYHRLVIQRDAGGGFSSHIDTAPLETSIRFASGTIQSSLFAAADRVGLSDEVAIQIAEVMAGRIDFHRGLRRGDSFNVVYEITVADGEPVGTGRVLAVSFQNNGRTHEAIWFHPPGRKSGAYFTPEGLSIQGAYLASPMEFSRVTSGFAMRFHPVLQRWRAHLGVDYGAPTGTPVRVVGEGAVEFAGVQNGFGKVVIVRHNASDTTLYAHLSRIDVRKGQRLEQGQRIGAVGSTGWATGPHLHFEFRVNGVHKDPLTVARKSEGSKLSQQARTQFARVVAAWRPQLATTSTQTAMFE